MTIRSDAATDIDSTQTNRCSRKCSLHLYRYTEQMKGALPQRFRQSAAVEAGSGVRPVRPAGGADDGATEEVAGLFGVEVAILRRPVVGQLAQGSDQALEGDIAVAALKCGEGLGGEAGLGESNAGCDPGRAEIVRVVGDRVQRLALGTAGEAGHGKGDRDIGAPRLEFSRLAQRQLVPGRQKIVRSRGDELVEEGLYFGGRQGSGELVDDLAVSEDLHGWDSLYPVERRQPLVGVDVHLDQLDLSLSRSGRCLQRRAQRLAGAAPVGPEIDHYRQLVRTLEY